MGVGTITNRRQALAAAAAAAALVVAAVGEVWVRSTLNGYTEPPPVAAAAAVVLVVAAMAPHRRTEAAATAEVMAEVRLVISLMQYQILHLKFFTCTRVT